MRRHVSCSFEAELGGTTAVVLSVAVADEVPRVDEELLVTLDGQPLEVREVLDDHGARLHTVDRLGPGRLEVDYRATITGAAEPPPSARSISSATPAPAATARATGCSRWPEPTSDPSRARTSSTR